MILTAEQVKQAPDLLSQNRSKSSFGYLDGLLGGVLFDGKAFVTTPNADELPEPILGLIIPVRLRQDGRFGPEDPFQRPQMYVSQHPHLACIRRPPIDRFNTQDIMFFNPTADTHFLAHNSSRLGILHPNYVSRLRLPSIELAKRYYAFIDSRKDLEHSYARKHFNGHLTQLKIWIARLENTKATWPDILFSVTQTQRHYLELEAFLEYMEVRQLLMNRPEYGEIKRPVGNFVGAFTNKVVVVEEFAKAGVPVWLIRPIKEFNELTRIDAVVTPTPPEDSSIELQPWRGHKTLAWNQEADHPQRHNNLMLFGREFLAYTDFGRTSAVRDTIERPPPVPSLGDDFSAGPSRGLPPKPDQGPTKPRIHLNPTDIIYFKPNPHPMMPIMMEAWAYGLSTVSITPDDVSPQYAEGDNGFIFPPPPVFLPPQTDGELKPRQLKILHAYITHSDILLLRMSPRNSPTSIARGKWHRILAPERRNQNLAPVNDSQPPSKKAKLDASSQRPPELYTLLVKWTNELDPDNAHRNETLAWTGEHLPLDRWPHVRVTERIIYEINEINLRWEFRMLDKRMTVDTVAADAHEDLVAQCFPSSSFMGDAGGDHMSVKYTTAWLGLSNPIDRQRSKYVLALARVLAEWKGSPEEIVAASKKKPQCILSLTRPAKRDLRGRMTIDIFSFLAPDVSAAHAFKESDILTILRTTSYHYQCPICKETYHREIDIRDHVSNAHTRDISRTSSTQDSSLALDASPLALKRRPCPLDEDIVANKRQRIDPSSTPPPSVSSAIPEPPSDLTLIPSSPVPQSTAELPPVRSSHRARRREVVKYFTLPMAGLYFHAPTRLLVCVECNAAVHPTHLTTHVNESCPRAVIYDRDALASKLQALQAHEAPDLPLEGLDTPIPLLPIVDGWRCKTPGPCFGHVFGAQSSKNAHHRNHHSDAQPNFSVVRCQQVYKLRSVTTYVALNDTPAPPEKPKSLWGDLKTKLQAEGILTLKDERAISRTQLSPLENVTKWHRAIETADLTQVRLYSRKPEAAPKPTIYHRLFDAFKQYIVDIVAPVLEMRSNTMLLRLINSSDKGVCDRYPFRLPQNAKTVSDYAFTFSCMMTFICRAVQQPIPGFALDVTESQLQCLKDLVDKEIPVELDLAPPSFWADLHSLCWSILTSIPVSTEMNELHIPLTRFLIAYHLKDDCTPRFKAPSLICHNMISIQWCWRAMALYQCKQLAPQNPEGEMGVYESISEYLTEASHCPFAVLRCHIHPITAISMQEPSLPLFLMGTDMETFSFKAHPFSMSAFKKFAVGLVDASEKLMLAILDGVDISSLEEQIDAALTLDNSEGWFKDVLRNDEAGYSFFTDERNGFRRHEDLLMNHLCRSDSNVYAFDTPDGLQLKPNALSAFIHDVDELVEHLYAALNFTWAGAARGTEIEDIRYRNGHASRNIYFTNGVLTFVTFYNKTQHNTGRPSMIPRAVPPRLARLFIILIAVIYPCTKVIAAILHTKQHAVLYESCIFVHRGRPLNTERMTEILRRFTQESFVFPLGVRDCRHLMKFVLKHAVGIALQDETSENSSLYRILDELWGHSSKVSQTYYAVEQDTFSHIASNDVTKAQIFSLAYHEWLGIGYQHLPANLQIHSLEPRQTQTQTPTIASKLDTSAIMQAIYSTIPVIGDALQATVFDAVQKTVNPPAALSRQPELDEPTIHKSTTIIVHPSRKLALQRLYGTSEPRFTSPQQGEIFELVMQNTRHVLGILPTGGGKSLMFYGPPLVESEGITVVISPFASLAHQQHNEAKSHGIDVAHWPSPDIDCSKVRLLVAHAEHLNSGQLDDWLLAASNLGLLRRIIFDEAHEILISSNYRDCYSKVKQFIDLGVTLVFLTATIYRESIPSLAKAFAIDQLEVIAAPTVRLNLRYQVQVLGDQALLLHTLLDAFQSAYHRRKAHERLLVYCRSYKECEIVGNLLHIPTYKAHYTGDPTEDAKKKQQCQDDWLSGVTPALVATTGFGTGINHPHVTHVFVINPYDMVGVTQQTGRAGRSGDLAHTVVLALRKYIPKHSPDLALDHAGQHRLFQLLTLNTCRRIPLGEFDQESHSCHSLPGCTPCDYCEQLPVSYIPFHIFSLPLTRNQDSPPVPPRYTYAPRVDFAQPNHLHSSKALNPRPTQGTSSHVGSANLSTSDQSKRGSDDVSMPITLQLYIKLTQWQAAFTYASIRETQDEGDISRATTLRLCTPTLPLATTRPPAVPNALLPSNIPRGHHQTLRLNQAAGQRNRSGMEDRYRALDLLRTMKDHCLICPVLCQPPCGHKEMFKCDTAIVGYKCEYTYNQEPLEHVYERQFKPAISFSSKSSVCYICYFPFHYKKHTLHDTTCLQQKDILLPIAWALFCLSITMSDDPGKALQLKVLEAAGYNDTTVFNSPYEYGKWLSQPHTTAQKSSNLVELCIAFARLNSDKSWP
ncbi:hypothetical protein EYR38_009890 [Pleurotus pulmonarius]|nr:hypothetical protein EYR38_009890 [Pleurotus pulmonarius]